jgi:alkaline phosphatase D
MRLAGAAVAGLTLPSCWPVHGFAPENGELDVLNDTGLSFGCAVGDITPEEAIVWLRAEDESGVQVHYGVDAALKEFLSTPPIRVTGENDFIARFRIDGLKPRTTYYCRAAVYGKRPGPIGRFVTAPPAEETATVRFAFSGDSREWYQPFSIMDSIRLVRPDFFVHLGDTIYADRDWIATELPDFWSKYRANRKDLPTQRLLSETSLYVTWDDHEVADNYVAGHPLASIGQRAFFDYWPIREDARDPLRLYRSFRWGKAAELFILDTRQYRKPEERTILGKNQKAWLMQAREWEAEKVQPAHAADAEALLSQDGGKVEHSNVELGVVDLVEAPLETRGVDVHAVIV